ncbi:MAG: FlgD immunoglobulin-like domain containing protein [Prolixibacteraceae bacterium]|nr:FlgD immunoglobulin-like domain containing protein [Prolixibacteraceae bacterium]
MTRFIFIFSIILVYFLTIVSCDAFGKYKSDHNSFAKIENLNRNDTISTILSDDFENNSISGWKQTTDWEVSTVEKISGELSLKHASIATSGNSSIFHLTNSDLNSTDIEWSFKLKNGNWDPSSANRFWFYLSADTILSDLINGWAVGVNISGSSDLLELWRISNGKADSLIVESDLDWNASTLATITAKRTTRGVWTLQYQKSGEAKSKLFSGSDPAISAFKNVGLYFNYTPTRAGQLWIDDISVVQLASELFIQKLTLINSNTIRLTFNRAIDPESIRSGNFKLTDESGQNVSITQVTPTKSTANSIDVSFGKSNGNELSLNVLGISDLSGKTMTPDTLSFSYTFAPEIGSILINEVLFNPFSGGVDFVELVNVSEQTIPTNRLRLATRDDALALKQIYQVTTEKRYLKPGEFLVCTKDPAILASQYFTCNPASFCAMKSFPSYSDDTGTVVLLNDSLNVLDEFGYSAKMHSPFLADEEGVSLERISLEMPTNDRTNWTSAAASVGFATPGLPNSQAGSETEIQDEITSEPKAFSPNSDGYYDELTINFRLSKPGYIANVRIFDAAGRQVRFLIKNQLQAQEGSWTWDGKSESGQKLVVGVYIILVEVFDQEGHTRTFKKTCTLTDRLER